MGDCIAVTDLVMKLYKTLDEALGSAADYRSLMADMYAVHRGIMEVERILEPSHMTEPVRNSLRAIFASARMAIERVLADIDGYRIMWQRGGRREWPSSVIRKFGWATLKGPDVLRLC